MLSAPIKRDLFDLIQIIPNKTQTHLYCQTSSIYVIIMAKTIGGKFMQNTKKQYFNLCFVILAVLLFLGSKTTAYAAEQLTLNESKITLSVGNEFTLEITEEYDNTAWWQPTYQSSDTKIVQVDSYGVVHAVGKGKASILVTYNGMEATCEVVVKASLCRTLVSKLSLFEGERDCLKLNFNAYEAKGFRYRIYKADTMEQVYSGLYVTCQNGMYDVYAKHEGTYLLELIVDTVTEKSYSTFCSIEVKAMGVTVDSVTMAQGTTFLIELKNAELISYSVENSYFNSQEEIIATIDDNGLLTGVTEGRAILRVSYLDFYKEQKEDSIYIYVTNPTLVPSQKACLAYQYYYPNFTGISYNSTVKICSDNEEVAKVYNDYAVYFANVGTATLTYYIDGCELKETVHVINPQISHDIVVLKKKETFLLEVTGATPESTITYESSNSKIVSVSKSGEVCAKKEGSAYITVTIDGLQRICSVTVASGEGYNAVKAGEKVLGAAYSQEKRMEDGYYDCSSFVWRMYKDAGYHLAGEKNYAPTAANLAKELEKQGKVISYEMLDASELKPGDLIFYTQGSDNGRYKNIYHVSMFYGSIYESGFWNPEITEYGVIIHASNHVTLDYYTFCSSSIVMIARPYGK